MMMLSGGRISGLAAQQHNVTASLRRGVVLVGSRSVGTLETRFVSQTNMTLIGMANKSDNTKGKGPTDPHLKEQANKALADLLTILKSKKGATSNAKSGAAGAAPGVAASAKKVPPKDPFLLLKKSVTAAKPSAASNKVNLTSVPISPFPKKELQSVAPKILKFEQTAPLKEPEPEPEPQLIQPEPEVPKPKLLVKAVRPLSQYTDQVKQTKVFKPTYNSLKEKLKLKKPKLIKQFPTVEPQPHITQLDTSSKDYFRGIAQEFKGAEPYKLTKEEELEEYGSQQELDAYRAKMSEEEAKMGSEDLVNLTAKRKFFAASGRRKRAVASAYLFPNGTGEITVNRRPFSEYFRNHQHREQILSIYLLGEVIGEFTTKVVVHGGGISAQAQAVKLAVARALLIYNPAIRPTLKLWGALTRDPREVERKKPGQKKARKKFQWTKR